MPVQIDVYDFQCFNQLRNASDFTRNPGDFTPNLVGNVGEKVKVVFKANLSQSAYTENLEVWNIDIDQTEITRSSGSFLDDRIQVGDKYKFYSNWSNRKNISNTYTGQVDFISSDGRVLRYTVLSGAGGLVSGEQTNVGLSFDQLDPVNLNTALFLKFGLIGNSETFDYVSKTTENLQVYYLGGLATSVGPVVTPAESLGTIKDWVSGSASFGLSDTAPDFEDALYLIEHEFVINPFYILAYRQFIENGTVPDIFEGDEALTYAAELEFRKSLTNTGSSKSQIFDGLQGFTGWYNENFNGLNPDYGIVSVEYEDSATGDPFEGVNISAPTKITITVEKIGGSITSYSCGVYIFKVPTSEDQYIGTSSDLISNFIYLSEIVSSPDTSTPNVQTSLVSDNLVIEYTLTYSVADRLRLTETDEFILLVQVEDPTLSVGNSDRVMLLADFKNYVDVDYVSQFIEVPTYNFLAHGQILGVADGVPVLDASNEDGLLLDAVIGSDVTRSVIIDSISVILVAFNSSTGESFTLDTYAFSLGELSVSGGIQNINVNSTRGYALGVNDEFNLARIITLSQVGDFQQYSIQVGQKIKWQDWLFNPDVPSEFYDAALPNNNQNFKSSNYSNENGFQIHIALAVGVTGLDDLNRSISGTFLQYGGVLNIQDYGESTDGVTGIIETFDPESEASLDGDILYNGKNTLLRATFSNAANMQYGIHRIEPSQNAGDGIIELSSLVPPISNSLLIPLEGETGLKFEFSGPDLITESLIDGSRIEENVAYKLSARVGQDPPLPPYDFQNAIRTSNNELAVANVPNTPFNTTPYSISLWVRQNELKAGQGIGLRRFYFFWFPGGGSTGFNLEVTYNDTVDGIHRWAAGTPGLGAGFNVFTADSLDWINICVTLSSDFQLASQWVNGVKDTDLFASFQFLVDYQQIFIGQINPVNHADLTYGDIVCVENHALTQLEVNAIYNGGLGNSYLHDFPQSQKVFEYLFNETNSIVAPDTSNNGYDMDLWNYVDTGFGTLLTLTGVPSPLFQIDEVVTGSISGAMAIVVSNVGTALTVKKVFGRFVNGDIVSSGTTNGTVSTVLERAWDEF